MHPTWSPATRVAFRFSFVYLLLYNLPFPFNVLPGPFAKIGEGFDWVWQKAAVGFARLAFGIEITVFTNGSGDTTFNYVQVLMIAILSAIATLVWSVLDRRRLAYERLHLWLRTYVRFTLAATMVAYGAVKVIKSQFPNPTLDRLLQPIGDASPMGLLWTFMGASAAYNIFSGLGEMLGGVLLTTRRTTLLGALISAAVMTHVAVLNFSYDVPVKLYSTHLLAMAVFLMIPDLRRLANVFVLNRPVEPVVLRPLFASVRAEKVVPIVRTAVVIAFVSWQLIEANAGTKEWGDASPRSPLYGIWNVEEFVVDGKPRQPLVSDLTRWRRVVFDSPRIMAVQFMSDSRLRYLSKIDTTKRSIELTQRDDPKWMATLAYNRVAPDRLELSGTVDGKQIVAKMQRVDASQYRLVSRGFHWINEYPFNR